MMFRLALSVLLALAVFVADVWGCGDKFLVVGRNTRFQRARVARTPAAILLYAAPQSTFSAVLTKLSVESGLRKAGYSATAVSSPDALDRAMRDSTWDVVVADLRDIDAVRTRLHGDTRPAVLVVVFDAPSDVVKTAKRTYHGVVKSPTHCATLVSAVDEALLDRAEAIAAANRKSR